MSESIQKIRDFIEENHYTWTIGKLLKTYREYYKQGYYCSATAKYIIEKNLHHFKVIDVCLRKKGL